VQFIHIEGFQLEVASPSRRNVFCDPGRDVNGRLHDNASLRGKASSYAL
jgi:hypothetical protein